MGILSKAGVRGLVVCGNITNNTQVDVVSRGIVAAIKDKGIDPRKFPVLVRYAGVNDAVGREVFTSAGIEYYGEEITMTLAARKMVEKMKQVYPDPATRANTASVGSPDEEAQATCGARGGARWES